MSRTLVTATVLGLIALLAASSPSADSGQSPAMIAGSTSANPGGNKPAIISGQQHSPVDGHRYAPAPPIHEPGPISPVPPIHMTPYPPNHWHDGRWYHGDHDHRNGWWWIAGGIWFWFPVPVYPYPDPYVPPMIVVPAPPIRYWYWCDRPAGYYPYISQCELPWRPIPATPPPPPQ